MRDFGVNASEDTLRWEAATNGWYQPGGGTSPRNVGNLLELHGVPIHRYEGATIFNLTSELARGHKVIVGVDAGELWNKGFLEKVKDQLGLSGANHALLVSGIDTSDPSHVQVVLTDPGSGDVAKAYPLEQFIDAWKDSNCFMVATKEPAPLEFNPSMVNFDYVLGHLPAIGQLPFDTFQQIFSPYFEYDPHNPVFVDQADLLVDAVNGHLHLDDRQDVEGTILHDLADGDSFPAEDAFLLLDDPSELSQSRGLFENDDSHDLSGSEDNTDNDSL